MADILYAWMTRDPTGKWSQISAVLGVNHITLTHRDRRVIDDLRRLALSHGRVLRQPVELRRYEHVETLEEHREPIPPARAHRRPGTPAG